MNVLKNKLDAYKLIDVCFLIKRKKILNFFYFLNVYGPKYKFRLIPCSASNKILSHKNRKIQTIIVSVSTIRNVKRNSSNSNF